MRAEGKQNEDLYYFSLRYKNNETIQNDIEEQIKELYKLFKAISNNRNGKILRVIVDDINRLE